MSAIRTHLDSLDGPTVVGGVLIFAGLCWLSVQVARWIVAGPHLDDTDPQPRVPRLASEWGRLQAFQAQARADIAAEADSFDRWEREMSA